MRTNIRIYKREFEIMNTFIEKNIFFLLLVGIICMFSVISFVKYGKDSTNHYLEITVSQGDTLWEIAQEYNYNNIDTSKFIAQVKDVNNLNGKILKAGDHLLIPVSGKVNTYLTMDE